MSDEPERYLHFLECLSCGKQFQRGVDKGVPIGIECCRRCWSRVPVAERLKLQLSIRDRSPGGLFSEMADLIGKSISHWNETEGKTFDDFSDNSPDHD